MSLTRRLVFLRPDCIPGCALTLLIYGVLGTSCLKVVHAVVCPHIYIEEIYSGQCNDECSQGYYCQDGRCVQCSPCPDPYTLAEEGEIKMLIRGECIDGGSCPNTCAFNTYTPKGNITLCDCVGVTPPPPTEPPTIMCKEGCSHGACINAGECNCENGWTGDLCDQCVPEPDCMHGYCNMTGECICHTGWGGEACDQDTSYCGVHQPCLNDGTCVNDEHGRYTCQCVDGYFGTNCENETSLHRCQQTCHMNATCIEMESGDSYQCECKDGITGADCVQPYADTSSPWTLLIIAMSVVIFIVVVILLIYCFRRFKILNKLGSLRSNDSGVNLIDHVCM